MFSPIKNKKVYEQIIDQIQEMVMTGELKRGDKLPSERSLSEQLGVSRTSVREALRALDVIGLTESRQGGGNYIRDNFENSLFQPLSVMFMLQQSSAEEILSLRKVLEIEAATLAAERITPKYTLELTQLITALKEATHEEQRVAIDKEFHYKIAKASGNFLLLNTLNAISTLVEYFIKDARASILSGGEKSDLLIKQHEDMCKAIVSHDPEAAILAMKKHFDLIEKEYLTKFR